MLRFAQYGWCSAILVAMSNLTLILNLSERIGIEGRSGINVRTPSPLDTIALGVLYFDSYPPGIADSTPEEATADIAASFAGDYGELWLEASPVAATDDGLVGAVLTVRQAPWSDTPDGPFVIELFTAPDHRRKEIGRSRIERSYRATCCESMITG